MTDLKFCNHLTKTEWHGPQSDTAAPAPIDKAGEPPAPPMLAFLKTRFKLREEDVERIWVEAVNRHREFEASKTQKEGQKPLPAAYPPGSCAAPKILMLIMQDKGRPAGITEQWFHKKEKPTAGEVQYYDNREGRMELTRSPFDHGTTVPPCDTCDLLVPMMLCPDDVPMKCEH